MFLQDRVYFMLFEGDTEKQQTYNFLTKQSRWFIRFGQCLSSVWAVFGQCLSSVWAVFGQCLKTSHLQQNLRNVYIFHLQSLPRERDNDGSRHADHAPVLRRAGHRSRFHGQAQDGRRLSRRAARVGRELLQLPIQVCQPEDQCYKAITEEK